MPYTFDNVTISIYNDTAVFATDYGTSGDLGISAAHVQILKSAWGGQDNTYRTSESYPFPVKLYGITATTVPVTGTVSGTGAFFITNTTATPIIVKGSTFTTDAPVAITGSIQGITNGIPVTITGGVNILNQIGIFGISGATAVAVTGGRRLNSTTDSVSVVGNVGISGGWALTSATDSVAIYGYNGATHINVNLYSSGRTAIGMSGDSLKVAITNTGISFSIGVTFNSTVGITNSGAPLTIQGASGGTPLTIRGSLAGGVVEVGAYTALPVSMTGSMEINDTDIISAINDLKPNIGSVATNAAYALDILNLINGTGVGAKVNVTTITKPSKLVTGLKTLSTSPALLSNDFVKVGVTIKSPLRNQTDIYIGSNLNMTPATSYLLSPGESLFLEVSNLANIFLRTVNGTADIVYIGS